jgi:hypothetical protein
MSMAFGDGGPYGALVQAMAQRRQRMAQQAPQQQPMQPIGGTMKLQVPQMPQAGGAAPQTAAGGFASGMSASSMAEMLKRARGLYGGGGDMGAMKADTQAMKYHSANVKSGGSSGMDV